MIELRGFLFVCFWLTITRSTTVIRDHKSVFESCTAIGPVRHVLTSRTICPPQRFAFWCSNLPLGFHERLEHEPTWTISEDHKKFRKSTGVLCPMSVTHLQDSHLHLCYLWSVLTKLQPQWRSQSNAAFPNMPTSSLPSQVHGMLQSSGNAENAWYAMVQ